MSLSKMAEQMEQQQQNTDTTQQLNRDIFEAAQCGDTNTVKGYLDLGVPVDVTDEDGWSPVHHALAYRQVEVIRLLMDRGCLMRCVGSRKIADSSYSSPHSTTKCGSKCSETSSKFAEKQHHEYVFEAARNGNTATVNEYLDSGVSVDITDEDGWSPVHHAIAYRQVEVIRLLMDRGCLMNRVENRKQATKNDSLQVMAEDGSKNSSLTEKLQYGNVFEAARCGDTDAVKAYLDSGIPVDLTDEEGRTILHCAAGKGQIKVVELLIERGCRIDLVDNNGWTPSICAIAHGCKETCQLLKQIKGPCEEQDLMCVMDSESRSHIDFAAIFDHCDRWNSGTSLHRAAAIGNLQLVNMYLRFGERKSMTKVADNIGTPLHQAVGKGHKDIVSLLLNEGCPINVVDSKGGSVLHYAAESGQIDMIKMLAGKGLDVNVGDNEGFTPLHKAAVSGQLGSVRTLLTLDGRKSITKVASIGGTPLHQAISKSHKDIVSLLVNELQGCPIDVVDHAGRSIFDYAVTYGQIDMIKMLAEKGFSVNKGDNEGWTPLHEAAVNGQLETVYTLLRLGGRESMTKVAGTSGTPLHQAVGKGHKDMVSFLLNEGCPIRVVDSKGTSVLHTATEFGQIGMIEMLAEQELDVNVGDDEGRTPLHCAAAKGSLDSVCTLLRLGGRKSMTKVAGTDGTPLHQAAINGHKDIVEFILSANCFKFINVVDSKGRSPIHFAARFGHIDIIEMLSRKGLNVNDCDNEGGTPLHAAAGNGHLEAVRTLLQLGGKKSMMKVAGLAGTPLHQAVVEGHKDIVSLMLNEGCPVDVIDSIDISPIHLAAQQGHIDLIEFFAEQGLDVNVVNNEGRTPLHLAACYGQLGSVRALLRLGGMKSMTKVADGGGTPVHQAVGGGHKDIVSLLFDEGCPINVVDDKGTSLIHYAALKGQIDMIEMLAGKGLDVNIGDDKGCTPLHSAAVNDQIESVHTLLRLGGRKSLTRVAETEGTPLHVAISKGHKNMFSLLLHEGCPINVVDNEGKGLVHCAAMNGQIDMIEMLAKLGLQVYKDNNRGWTPLHSAAYAGEYESVCTLLRLGAKKSMTKVAGLSGTPLHQAVVQGHKDIVSLLLSEGCPVDVVNSEGISPIHAASSAGQIDMIKMFADHEANVNIGNCIGETPLHYAAVRGQYESMHTLLRLGGRKSITTVAGPAGTPIHYAAVIGDSDMVSVLLNEGSQNGVFDLSSLANICSSEKMTPLMWAAMAGNVTTFKELVKAGGDIHLSDNFGMTFGDYILMHNTHQIVEQICLKCGSSKLFNQFCERAKQFCAACGIECSDEGLLGVISALSTIKLLDINKILCLAAMTGNVHTLDFMIASHYPLDQQRMSKVSNFLSFVTGGKTLPDRFHISDEPLNPLQISLLSVHVGDRFNVEFIEKLTSHKRTQYTVNEPFPNGLSPLDVARKFELHDIAVLIERAGGGPGAWADLPKEIEEKSIAAFTSLKELRGCALGDQATSRILSLLGIKVADDGSEVRKKVLQGKPTIVLIDRHFLRRIKAKKKWKRVGRLLGISEEKLSELSEEGDDDDIYYSMLEHWVDCGHTVSWNALFESVSGFEVKSTIDDIIDKIVEELSPSQVRN